MESCEGNFTNQEWDIELQIENPFGLQELAETPTLMFKHTKDKFFWGFVRLRGSHFGCLTPGNTGTPTIELVTCNKKDQAQKLAFVRDLTIRINGTNKCLTHLRDKYLAFSPCSETSTRWAYNLTTRVIKDLSTQKCITHQVDNKFNLSNCDSNLQNNKWIVAKESARFDPKAYEDLIDGCEKGVYPLPPILRHETEIQEDVQEETPIADYGITLKISQANIPNRGAFSNPPKDAPQNKPIDTGFLLSTVSETVAQTTKTLHEQFAKGLQTDHENRLAEEIRQMYCQVNKLRRAEVTMLAQSSGLLAAQVLKLGDCAKVQGYGQVLLYQQCQKIDIEVLAQESERCGFQPLFRYKDRNYTIGMDGWSMHPFSSCFWPTHFVNINGKTYFYERSSSNQTSGDWKIQEATFHASNLDLVSKFSDDIVKNYNYELRRHPAHETNELEQLNIVADIVGRIQNSEDGTLERLTVSENFLNNLGRAKSMSATAILATFSLSGLLTAAGVTYLYIRFRPVQVCFQGVRLLCKRRRLKENIELENITQSGRPLLPVNNPSALRKTDNYTPVRAAAAPPEHPHETLRLVNGKLFWDDGCPISNSELYPALPKGGGM